LATEEIGNLVSRVRMDGTDFQQGVTKLSRQLKVVKSEFKVAEASIDKFGNKTDYLKAKSDSLSKELTIQKKIVKELEDAHEKSAREKGEDARATQNLQLKLNRAKASMVRTEKQIGHVNDELRDQQRVLATTGSVWGRNYAKMKDHVRGMKDEVGELNTALKGILLASGVGISAAVYQAASFEQALADVKAVSGASEDQMKRLSETALDLGESTKYSARQALQGALELIKAGIPLEEVIGGSLASSLNLATAGELDLAEASKIASTGLNAFEQDNIDTARAADILAGAANASATNVSEMQQGLAQVSSVASSAGLSFEETATALATLAQNGLRGSDAGTSLKTMLMRLTPDTKQAKDAMKDLGIITEEGVNKFYDANGELKDFNEVVGELHKAMDDLNPQQRASYLKEMFGTDAYRAGAIFFKESAEGINDMNEALNKVTAADVAAEKMDTFLGKVEELKSSLQTLGVEVGDEFLPMVTDTVKELTGMIRTLSDVNPEIVATGLKATAAASGVGLLASGIAHVSRALIALRANPIGLAITGISLLTGAIVASVDAYKRHNEINYDKIEAMEKEVKSTEKLADRFDQLDAKNQLANDEMLRYMDIQSDLEQTTAPDKVKALKDEQAKLLEKSNLTNEEMEEFLGLNEKVVEKAPATEQAISSEGNAYAFNTEKLRELNEEKRKELKREARTELLKALDKEGKLEREKNRLVKERKGYLDAAKNLYDDIDQLSNERIEKEEKLKSLKEELANAEGIEVSRVKNRIEKVKEEISQNQFTLDQKKRSLGFSSDLIKKNREQLDEVREQIKELDTMKFKYEDLVLAEADLTAEKGAGVSKIEEQIDKLEHEKDMLKIMLQQRQINTSEYNEQNKKIDEQLGKLDQAKKELGIINQLAGDTVYKEVKIQENPDNYWDDLNSKLSTPIDKYVNIYENIHSDTPRYASGTNGHPGGSAIISELGRELLVYPNGQFALSNDDGAELANLPEGTHVVPNNETEKFINNLKTVPSYASGTGSWDLVEGNEPQLVQTSDGSITKKIRDIRQAEMDRLERQIEYLKRESATLEELNAAKEKEARLNKLRSEKRLEYQHRLEEQEVILNLLAKAHKNGEINAQEYNQRVGETKVRINELKSEVADFNMEIARQNEELKEQQEEQERKQRQAIQNQFENAKNQLQSGIDTVDKFGQEVMYALENKYQAQMEVELKAEKESYDNLISSLQNASNQLQEKWAEQDYENKMSDLQRSLEHARTPAERKRIQEKIEEEEKKMRRKSQMDSLRDQIEHAREEKEEAIQSVEKKYEELMQQENIESEARKMLVRNNQNELVNLLNSYNSDWQDAGRSFGEKFVKGLKSQMNPMREAVREMINLSHGAIQGYSSLQSFMNSNNLTFGNAQLEGMKEVGGMFKPSQPVNQNQYAQPPQQTPQVKVYLGNEELSEQMYETVNEKIASNSNDIAYASGVRYRS